MLEQQYQQSHNSLNSSRTKDTQQENINELLRQYKSQLLTNKFLSQDNKIKQKIIDILLNQIRDPNSYVYLTSIIYGIYDQALKSNLWDSSSLTSLFHRLIERLSNQIFQQKQQTQEPIYFLMHIALREINKNSFGENQKQSLFAFIRAIIFLLISNQLKISDQYYQKITNLLSKSSNQMILKTIKDFLEENLIYQELPKEKVSFMVKFISKIIQSDRKYLINLTQIVKKLIQLHYPLIEYKVLANLLKSFNQILMVQSRRPTSIVLNMIELILKQSQSNQPKIKCVQRKKIREMMKRLRKTSGKIFKNGIKVIQNLIKKIR